MAVKFVQGIADKDGELYPVKTMYHIECCIKRHLEENGRMEANPLDRKSDS